LAQPTPLAPLHSPAEVAAAFKISRKGVYRLHESGELPAIRIRGVLRFRSEDLRDYLLRQRSDRSGA
jgi:excisionase family DNA binding protein